ncbi:MAG: alpha/beta fold hydrolase [Deltaproteobacteria bacterium]|nr:alpha/beta fold hydrolase [Deltaproteobacteria bacterium]
MIDASVSRIETSPIEIAAHDGWRLRGDRIRPDGPVVARAVLGHAMMVDRRTMDRPRGAGLASVLVSSGIEVLNVDLRGHGDSGPSARDGGRFAYDDFVRLDVPALVAHARGLSPRVPLVVVGHSLMGHAAILAAGLTPSRAPDAIVALAANLWTRKLEPSTALRWAKGGALVAWAGVMLARNSRPSLAPGRVATSPSPAGRGLGLTRNSALAGGGDAADESRLARLARLGSETEPWPYVRQFLRMYFRNHIASADGSIDYEAAMGRVAVPVLSVVSDGDRLLARPASVDAFMAMLPPGRVTHLRVSGLDHMGLVVRPDAAPVWMEIARWIRDRAGRAGSSQ